jgi:RNA polymerase sigma-70 factor (ECF subfamily)
MREENLDENELIARVITGDVHAFEVLYDRYSAAVMGLAVKITRDKSTAEDIVQEAFWTVWEKADKFDPERGSFINWLLTVTRNLSLDSWRRFQSRPQPLENADTQEFLLQTGSDGLAVDQEVWMNGTYERVRLALADLPPEQKDVIESAYFHGKTRRQIADEMNIPLGTIHTRARLALQKLQVALQNVGIES